MENAETTFGEFIADFDLADWVERPHDHEHHQRNIYKHKYHGHGQEMEMEMM